MPKRVGMLFLTVYLFILMFDFTSSDELFPHFIEMLIKPYTNFWNWMVPWTGSHILHLREPITIMPNGSGDTTFNYVMQLLWVVFAFVIALVWALLDRKRRSYDRLYHWTRIFARYYFAYTLFTYGFIKIMWLQMPFPNMYRLTETYGDSSPMGLAWTFFGYSRGYSIFMGTAEALAGALLLFRRTTLLGSLIAMVVMVNVVAVNFAFDVPVKIFSTNLLGLAVFLAAHDLERLVHFFFLGKITPSPAPDMPFQTRGNRIARPLLKLLFIGFIIYSAILSDLSAVKARGDRTLNTPLYGIYNTESFIKNGVAVPPLTTDSVRWKQMIINYPTYARTTTMADRKDWWRLKLDTMQRTARFTALKDSTDIVSFQYSKPDKEHLQLKGVFRKDSLLIYLKRMDIDSFKLVSRGFHWVNEYPDNQ